MPDKDSPTLGVGMVGLRLHGRGALAGLADGRSLLRPAVQPADARAGRARPEAATAAAAKLGWGEVATDWKQLLTRDDVQLVDICTPGDTHAEIAIAALEAGKHVLCEKPLANTVAEAEAMVAAAARGGRARRPLDGRLQLPPGPGDRAGPAAGGRGPARARSGTCARSTCRTGSSTRSSRWSGGCRRTGRVPVRSVTSAAHIVDLHAVRHRSADHRGLRADRDVHQGAPVA